MDARLFTQRLSGHWVGHYGTAPCPVCQPDGRSDQNALTIRDSQAKLLLHCKKTNCAFIDILAAAGWRQGDYAPPKAATLVQREIEQKAEIAKRASQAKKVWNEAKPIAGTIAETYLRERGITCELGEALRFHSSCWHGPTAKYHPALIALVNGASLPAVHRTYLRPDGLAKAEINRPKLMLGSTAGGAVRLTDESGPLVVAEGIETALSLASGLLRLPATVWAALSTSGLRGLHLPDRTGRLTIASDGDAAGRAAAQALATRAHTLGWQVSLLPAPDGRDWNDILVMKGETK